MPAQPLDLTRIRADFPILGETVEGHPLAYLDSAATSQRPRHVIDAEIEFVTTMNSAVHRGAHTLASRATDAFEDARDTVSRFVGVGERELVWTHGATEGLNLLARSFGDASAGLGGPAAARFALLPGDEIVVSEAEHHANLIPWQELARRTGAILRHIPVFDDGRLDLVTAASLMGPRTRVLAFSHVSNVLGIVNPVDELTKLAHDAGALVVLDACQSAPHLPLDLASLDVDFAVFSAHKMLGPTGVGALYGRVDLLDTMPPFMVGGSMITTVDLERAEWLEAPQRFEAGTQPVSQIVAFASAIDYLAALDPAAVHAHELALGERLLSGLRSIPGIRVLGDTDAAPRIALAAFDVDGVHAHDVGQFLDARGLAVRVGHHCAQPLHRRFGMTATTRASAYIYTTPDEIDRLLDAVGGVRAFFGKATP